MPFRGEHGANAGEVPLSDVLDRIDYTEHPNNADLYITEEQAEENVEGEDIDRQAPTIDWKDSANLTEEERVSGLRIVLT